MKTIRKILSILTILMLACTGIVAASHNDNSISNSTVIDNYTISTDSTPLDSGSYESEPHFKDEPSEKIITHKDHLIDKVFNGETYTQNLLSEDELFSYITPRGKISSYITDNITFERKLTELDERIPHDTYIVYTDDGEQYTVVVVYTYDSTGGYKRAQFYLGGPQVSVVTPAPMYICKPLKIDSFEYDWSFTTGKILSYKIVNSHYGKLKTAEKQSIQHSTVPTQDNKEIKKVTPVNVEKTENKNTKIINEETTINSTINETSNNTAIEAVNNENTTTSFNNSNISLKATNESIVVIGEGNIIKYFKIQLSNIKDSILNLNFNI